MIAEFVLYYGITLSEFHLGIYTCFSGKLKYPWIQALGGGVCHHSVPCPAQNCLPCRSSCHFNCRRDIMHLP